jgi:uncharacterized membrane protein YheB (UPF0754 family)
MGWNIEEGLKHIKENLVKISKDDPLNGLLVLAIQEKYSSIQMIGENISKLELVYALGAGLLEALNDMPDPFFHEKDKLMSLLEDFAITIDTSLKAKERILLKMKEAAETDADLH